MSVSQSVETGEMSSGMLQAETTVQDITVHPYVQPAKAALYFDSVQGFGEWRILISTAADANLRQTRKRSPELFRITIKKIKYV